MFATIGGIEARYLTLLSLEVTIAATSVARLPKTMSHRAHPVKRFDTMHPMNSPSIADGRYSGRMVSASDNRSWIAPPESPKTADISVRMT